jgi:hypothetical protein
LNLGSARPGEAIQTAAVEALTVLDLVRGYWDVLSVRFTHAGVVVTAGLGDRPHDVVQRYHHALNESHRTFRPEPVESTQDDYLDHAQLAHYQQVDAETDAETARLLANGGFVPDGPDISPAVLELLHETNAPYRGRHIKGDPA